MKLPILYTMRLSPVIREHMYGYDVIMTKRRFWFVNMLRSKLCRINSTGIERQLCFTDYYGTVLYA
jgi:hypothetical protein